MHALPSHNAITLKPFLNMKETIPIPTALKTGWLLGDSEGKDVFLSHQELSENIVILGVIQRLTSSCLHPRKSCHGQRRMKYGAWVHCRGTAILTQNVTGGQSIEIRSQTLRTWKTAGDEAGKCAGWLPSLNLLLAKVVLEPAS